LEIDLSVTGISSSYQYLVPLSSPKKQREENTNALKSPENVVDRASKNTSSLAITSSVQSNDVKLATTQRILRQSPSSAVNTYQSVSGFGSLDNLSQLVGIDVRV